MQQQVQQPPPPQPQPFIVGTAKFDFDGSSYATGPDGLPYYSFKAGTKLALYQELEGGWASGWVKGFNATMGRFPAAWFAPDDPNEAVAIVAAVVSVASGV
mmetsp:Transcript_41094/g.61574  ORF Transcript_41094/g.61574 Transcript_41094/m.61574 type:complete len:101 (-) Transcript_41094:143-445(-)